MPARTHSPLPTLVLAVSLWLGSLAGSCSSTPRGPAPGSDPLAVELAEEVLERIGGERAWESTPYVAWSFFGGRRHLWDKHGARLRLESEDLVVLLDLRTREGRAFRTSPDLAPTELEGEERAQALERAWALWINDSYWMFMPFKLRDPGVHLSWIGEVELDDGHRAKAIDLTFMDVGLTPENRYRVYINDQTQLVERWDYFARAEDEAPQLVSPWAGWKRFGSIWLATDHGRGRDWAIEVPATVDQALFVQP